MEFLSVLGKRVLMISCLLISTATITGQTVLIDPEGDGGFENGATFEENGWIVANGSQSPWTLGFDYDGYAPLSNRKAYASENGGQTAFVQSAGAISNFFYTDVSIPQGEEFITLEFDWYNESTHQYSEFQVYAGPTSILPQSTQLYYSCCQVPPVISGAVFLTGGFALEPELYMGVQHVKVQVPAEFAGTTLRLIFMVGKHFGQNSPGSPTSAIDNISLVSNQTLPLCGEYTIDNTLGNNIYAGGVNFKSFTDAIYHLNSNGKCGPVVFNVSSGQEFPESPPDIRVSGSDDAPIVFQKYGSGPNPIISPSGTGLDNFLDIELYNVFYDVLHIPNERDRCITLRGVSYLTWDGIDIIAANNLMERGFVVANSLSVNGASSNNTIRNCTVKLDKSNSYSSVGVSVAHTGSENSVENNTIENVQVYNTHTGINLWGVTGAFANNLCNNNKVIGCTIGAPLSEAPDGDILNKGISIDYQWNCVISGNLVQNVAGPSDNYGIYAWVNEKDLEISGNTVRHIRNSSESPVTENDVQYGIYINHQSTSIEADNILIFNNMISDISSNYLLEDQPVMVYGLRITGQPTSGSWSNFNFHVYHNSIALSNTSSFFRSVGVRKHQGTLDFIGNSIASYSTLEANSTPQHLLIGTVNVSDFNNFFHANPDGLFVSGNYISNTTSLAEWVENSNRDMNSISVNPQYYNFLSDLHANSSELVGAGSVDTIDFIASDIDGDPRPTPPTIGADEFTPLDCSPPSGVSVEMISGNSAVVIWESTLADSYNWELRDGVFPPGSDTTNFLASGNTSNTEVLIENIPYGSDPYFFIQSVCEGDETSMWLNELVAVPLACYPAPFVETFDDWTNSQIDNINTLDNCWAFTGLWYARHSSSTDLAEPQGWLGPDGLNLSSEDATTGNGSYVWYYPSMGLPVDEGFQFANNSLTSGDFDVTNFINPVVSMAVAFYNNGAFPGGDSYNELKLYARSGTEWIQIGVFDDASHPEWVRWNVTIPDTIPEITSFKLIVWRVSGNAPMIHPVMIDDFGVHEANASGVVYTDMNCNFELDEADFIVAGQIIRINDGMPVAFSDANGEYSTFLESTQIDSIYLNDLPAWSINNYGIDEPLPTDLNGLDFRLCPIGDVADLGVSVSPFGAPPRPGFNMNYAICRSNYGTIPSQSELVFNYGQMPGVSVIDAAGGSISDSTIIWQGDEIGIFETECIQIELHVAQGTEVGTVYTSEVFISTVPDTLIDVNMENNTHSFSEIVVAAYDPNDKTVDQPIVNHTDIDPNEGVELEYLIRFQNTGNFYATDVKVLDNLPDLLDINTFQMIHASHEFEMVFHDEQQLEWFFEDIMLPDSTSDEPNSHGYIHFRIKSVPGIQLEDIILNNASIYFDFKEAVVTDYAQTTFFNCSEGSLSISAPDTVCAGTAVELATNRGDFENYDWTVLDENYQGENIEVMLEDTGLYVITLDATHPVCTLSTSVEVWSDFFPEMDITPGNYIVCNPGDPIHSNCSGKTSWYLDGIYLGAADTMMFEEGGALNIICHTGCDSIYADLNLTIASTPAVELTFEDGVLIATPQSEHPPVYEYIWFLNDSLIADAPNNAEWVPVESGIYSVTIVYETGCSSVSSTYFVPVSLSEFESSHIQLYPNPAKSLVTLILPEGQWDVQLIDTRGKVMRTIQSGNRRRLELTTDQMARGVYFVMVYSASTSIVKKLVIN